MNSDEVEKNTWHPYTIIDKDEEKSAQFIILNVDIKDIELLLNGTKDTCSHTLLFATIYHLLKLKDKCDKLDTDKYELQDKAIKIMQEHKFYSILDRSNFEKQAKSREEYQERLVILIGKIVKLLMEFFLASDFFPTMMSNILTINCKVYLTTLKWSQALL